MLLGIGGLVSLGLMLVFAYFGIEFVRHGAGSNPLTFSVTPGGVLMGMIPFAGFLAGSGLCFLIGVSLLALAVVPPAETSPSGPK